MVSKENKAKNTRSFKILGGFILGAVIVSALLHLMMVYWMFDYAEDIDHQSLSMFEGLLVVFYIFIAVGMAAFCLIANIIASKMIRKINDVENPGPALSNIYTLIAFNASTVAAPIIGACFTSDGSPNTIRGCAVAAFIVSIIPLIVKSISTKKVKKVSDDVIDKLSITMTAICISAMVLFLLVFFFDGLF